MQSIIAQNAKVYMLNNIETFLKVVECGSFSKAAKALQMATSSVTRQIDALEKELCTLLLKRSTRSLVLTEEGERCLDEASDLLERAVTLKESFNADKKGVEGLLRVSVFESFGRTILCPLLKDFLEMHPNLNIDISLDNQIVDMHKDNVDVAIRIGIPADSALKARKLLTNNMLLAASPDYFKIHQKPNSPDELSSRSCLKIGRHKQRNYWHFSKLGKHKKILITGRLSSIGGSPIIQAALDGLGIARLSEWLIKEHLASGKLETCLEDWHSSNKEHLQYDVYAVYRVSKTQQKPITSFMTFLAQRFPLS